MQPGYKIEPDPARRFVRVTLYGFWDEATLEQYKADVRALATAAAKSPARGEISRVLLDMRQHVLLSKEHAVSLQSDLGDPPPGQRTAILLTNVGLLKRQAERVASALKPRFFTEEQEAIDWLFSTGSAD